MNEVTAILSAINAGNSRGTEQLLPLVYDELRKLAVAKMAQEAAGHTLQATALVHEACLRLIDGEQAQHWNSRGHFFAAAAEAMRRILVENARRKQALERGGDRERLDLVDCAQPESGVDLLALDDALDELAKRHPEKARLVMLRFFAGRSLEESAEILGVSRTTCPEILELRTRMALQDVHQAAFVASLATPPGSEREWPLKLSGNTC